MVDATNRTQELAFYDVAKGKLLTRMILDYNVLAARFVPEQNELLVLTATQRVYHLALAELAAVVDAGSVLH